MSCDALTCWNWGSLSHCTWHSRGFMHTYQSSTEGAIWKWLLLMDEIHSCLRPMQGLWTISLTDTCRLHGLLGRDCLFYYICELVPHNMTVFSDGGSCLCHNANNNNKPCSDPPHRCEFHSICTILQLCRAFSSAILSKLLMVSANYDWIWAQILLPLK